MVGVEGGVKQGAVCVKAGGGQGLLSRGRVGVVTPLQWMLSAEQTQETWVWGKPVLVRLKKSEASVIFNSWAFRSPCMCCSALVYCHFTNVWPGSKLISVPVEHVPFAVPFYFHGPWVIVQSGSCDPLGRQSWNQFVIFFVFVFKQNKTIGSIRMQHM